MTTSAAAQKKLSAAQVRTLRVILNAGGDRHEVFTQNAGTRIPTFFDSNLSRLVAAGLVRVHKIETPILATEADVAGAIRTRDGFACLRHTKVPQVGEVIGTNVRWNYEPTAAACLALHLHP